ncbi:class I adenylate-forming enzyme family protein [Cupriavidus pampae]|uniref:Long-chain-fatty-acid--CoA ligase n=1 Tax=Cupriavidus pampae TaxID=659251 RepID=A0ABN7YE19_9BURK|nr:AMP-binding protein [Cupriavidus pampae]CAG9171695.1 Long-chain-fatty-acid--CoA ligase [Cupriavidus pampae]
MTASPTDVRARRIHEVILPWVKRNPAAPALEDRRGRLSYGELALAVAQGASQLRALGVRGGDRVLLVAENCVAVGVLVLAASAIDAWVAVVNARLSPREIDNFIAHSGARRVLYLTEVSAEARAHAARVHADDQPWHALGRIGVGPLNIEAVAEPVHDDPREQVAALIYTSGTSGDPKGVMLTHENLLHVAELSRRLRQLGPADRFYGVLPMAHIVGLSSQLLGALSSGASIVFEERYQPDSLVRALQEDGVTILLGVPAIYARLVDHCRRHAVSLVQTRLRFAGTAGAPLTPELKANTEALLHQPLHNGYGLTEMAPTVAQTLFDAPRTDCSVGQPVPGVEVRIVDPTGQPLPRGEVGELWVRGASLMRGYYRAPELTDAVIDGDGWFNTGDLARQDDDDALFVVGRTKELIIRSGFNVYPVEVEQAINCHPAVVQSAVVGRDVQDNEEVVAFVELAANAALGVGELEAFLRERLSPYKVPSEIRFLAQLPAAPTGKIRKHELRALAAAARPAPAFPS